MYMYLLFSAQIYAGAGSTNIAFYKMNMHFCNRNIGSQMNVLEKL